MNLFDVIEQIKSGASTSDLVTQHPILFGIALGLATSSTCVASCGPVYAPFLMQRKEGTAKSFLAVLEISAGRFVTYILFGMIAGMLGKQMSSIGAYKELFTIIAYFLFSGMLIMSAVTTHNEEKGCSLKRWGKVMKTPFLLGILTGISFCPSFLIALTSGVSLNGPIMGGVLFFGFFLGSNAWLVLFGFFGVLGNQKVFRKIAILMSIAVGAYFIGLAIGKTGKLLENNKKKNSQQAMVSQKHKDKEIIDVFDATPLVVVGLESETFGTLLNRFIENRDGSIQYRTALDSLPENANLLISQDFFLANQSVKELAPQYRSIFVLPIGTKDGAEVSKAPEVVALFQDKKWFRSKTKGLFYNLENMFNPASCEDPTCTTKH